METFTAFCQNEQREDATFEVVSYSELDGFWTGKCTECGGQEFLFPEGGYQYGGGPSSTDGASAAAFPGGDIQTSMSPGPGPGGDIDAAPAFTHEALLGDWESKRWPGTVWRVTWNAEHSRYEARLIHLSWEFEYSGWHLGDVNFVWYLTDDPDLLRRHGLVKTGQGGVLEHEEWSEVEIRLSNWPSLNETEGASRRA